MGLSYRNNLGTIRALPAATGGAEWPSTALRLLRYTTHMKGRVGSRLIAPGLAAALWIACLPAAAAADSHAQIRHETPGKPAAAPTATPAEMRDTASFISSVIDLLISAPPRPQAGVRPSRKDQRPRNPSHKKATKRS
jgi:hypothetical protein